MTDTLTKDQRRRIMQANRGRTQVERLFASALWRRGLRYLTPDGYRGRYGVRLKGSPDLIFPRRRVVAFVDGCFWHGCPDCHGIPTQSGQFWRQKIETNVKRDRVVTTELEQDGWKVIRVPEHNLRSRADVEAAAEILEWCVRTW